MKIGLIDADKFWGRKSNAGNFGKGNTFPNIALMKISAYHKKMGDEVEWYLPFSDRYDIVYVSKVFTDTQDPGYVINADRVVRGGTGYCIKNDGGVERFVKPEKGYDYSLVLPAQVEHMMPDYSIYPDVEDTAYGFLTRGCPRRCGFCHVSSKEGVSSRKVADLSEWWSGQKNIVLMDPNILACRNWKSLLRQLEESGAWVDMNQGLDARLLTEAKIRALSRIRIKSVHFAWDDYRQGKEILNGLRLFKSLWPKKFEKGHQVTVYILVNFDTTIDQDLERIYTVRDLGFSPFVMVYDRQKASSVYRDLQRWVNNRAVFNSVPVFESYGKREKKGGRAA